MTSLLRTSVHGKIKRLVSERRLRVSYLVDVLDCVELSVDQLRPADKQLLCLTNINSPEQYFAFLNEQGLDCDQTTPIALRYQQLDRNRKDEPS